MPSPFDLDQSDDAPSGVYAISRAGVTRIGGAANGESNAATTVQQPDTHLPALSVLPTPAALAKSFAKCWRVALPIGLGIAASLAALVWTIRPSKSVTTAVIRITSERSILEDRTQGPNDLRSYTATQMALMKSPPVLNALLKADNIRQLPLLAKQPQPFDWLESEVRVEQLPGTELVRVSLSSRGNEADLPVIVNALVEAYLSQVVKQEFATKQAHLNDLAKALTGAAEKLRSLRDSYQALAQSLKGGDSKVLALKQQNLLNEYASLRRESASLNAQRQQIEARISLSRLRLSSDPADDAATGITDAQTLLIIERELETDPKLLAAEIDLETLRGRLRQLDDVSASSTLAIRSELVAQRDTATKDLERLKGERRKAITARYQAVVRLAAVGTIREAEAELALVKKQAETLQSEASALKVEVDRIGQDSVEIVSIGDDIARQAELYKSLGQQKERLDIEMTASNSQRVTPLAAAEDARVASKFGRLQEAAGAGFFGLLLTLLVFSLRVLRRGRIYSSADVSRGLQLRVLGSLPTLPNGPAVGPGLCVEGGEAVAADVGLWESIDRIRTLVLQQRRGQRSTVLMVASAVAGEGKSTLAVQLAASFARGGFRTLLVDGDLRSPSLHRLLETTPTPGFCDVLAGADARHEAVRQTAVPEIDLLPAGRATHQTAVCLAQSSIETALRPLRERYEIVVVDSSPLLLVPDGFMVAGAADGLILSVRPGTSRAAEVHEVCGQIHEHRLPFLGVVMNGVKVGNGYRYGRYLPPYEPPVTPEVVVQS